MSMNRHLAKGAPRACPCIVCRVQARQSRLNKQVRVRAERKLMIDQHEAFIMAEMSFRQSAAFATREGLSPTVWDQHADRMQARALAVGRKLFR